MRVVSGLLVLGFCFWVGAPAAFAAAMDGRWLADIPVEGRCNYHGHHDHGGG